MIHSTASTNTARPDHDPLVLPPNERASRSTYKSHNERFAADLTFPDGRPREDRASLILHKRDVWMLRAPHNRRNYRRLLRGYPKLHAAFKALREDKRFAAIALRDELITVSHFFFANQRLLNRAVERVEQELKRITADNPEAVTWCVPESHIIPPGAWTYACAHRAKINPTKIACYPTLADARRKREVVMSVGRFLTQAFPSLTPSEVQSRSEQWIAQGQPIKMHVILNDEPGVDAQETSDHWVRVYRNPHGFSSCMAHFDDTPYHPARFYARLGNHLGLAYLTHNDDPFGNVTARCIVNTQTETYVRVYGDARLAKALENPAMRADAGDDPIAYRLDPHRALYNVQCNAIFMRGRLVAPYLDGVQMIRLEDDHCIITDEQTTHECTATSGYVSERGRQCDCCGGYYDEDDMRYSEYHGRTICEYCRDDDYSYAYVNRYTQDWVNNDEVIHLNGEVYLDEPEVLEAHGFVWSEDEEEWLDGDDAVYLSYMADYVSYGNTVALDRPTPEGDERARECDTTTITLDGEELTVHEDYDGPEDEDDHYFIAA